MKPTGPIRSILVVLAVGASSGCGGGESPAAPAVATQLVVHAGADQTGVAGTDVAVRPSVVALDAHGSPIGGVSVTFAVAGALGTVAGAVQVTGSDGVATLGRWVLDGTPGVDSVAASAPGLSGSPVVFAATAQTGSAVALVAGEYHTCALTAAGHAYCWGENTLGQLGDGFTTNRSTPATVIGGHILRKLALAWSSTCALDSAGAAFCWGGNAAGMLGDGTTIARWKPVPVRGGLAFTDLAAGDWHVCGIATDGHAYCWGYNAAGQLGDGSTTDRAVPVAVSGGLTFAHLTAGGGHTCGLTPEGQAYCWGENTWGELGDSTMIHRSAPVAVKGGLTFTQLVAGGGPGFTCGLTAAGVAYCWGNGSQGQNGSSGSCCAPAPIVSGGLTFAALAAGSWHTCGITPAGGAWCWGNGYEGQLGDGGFTSTPTPVAVLGSSGLVAITAGGEHSCARTSAGWAYCWGKDDVGQLGDGGASSRAQPRRVRFF